MCTYEGYEFSRTATLLRDGKVLLVCPVRRTAVRPGQRNLVRGREDDHTAPRPHGHVAARRQGARGRRVGRRRSRRSRRRAGLGRAVRSRHGVLDRRRKADRHSSEMPIGDTTGDNTGGCESGYGWATLLPDGTLLLVPRGGSEFNAEIYDPATGTWTELAGPTECGTPRALLSDGTVLITDLRDPCTDLYAVLYGRGAVRPAHRVVDDRFEHAPVPQLVHAPARWHGPRGRWPRL